MNSFETDLQRAIISKRFFTAFILELIILLAGGGMESEMYSISIAVVCTFPYTIGLLEEYQSGYIKCYLIRTTKSGYIIGKLLSGGISGGLVIVFPTYIYMTWIKPTDNIHYGLIFMSGVLWAIVAMVLAVCSRSRYIAYGGSFVIYYLLVILHERYLTELYCLNPGEWYRYEHIWIFGEWGIVIMLLIISTIFALIYDLAARRLIVNV